MATDSQTYLIGGVEAKEGTALTKDQLRAIQVDKKNNPDKQYPEWVDKEYTARKDEVSVTADKPIFAATGRVSSRSAPPKTDKFAPKAQKESKETPVLVPKVVQGQNFSGTFPNDSNTRVESGLNADGSRSMTTTAPTGDQIVASMNKLYDNIQKGSVEDKVDVSTTTQTSETDVPVNSSAERAGA